MSSSYSLGSYQVSFDIQSVTHDPSTDSRLGDIGYVGIGGRWRRIVNMLDGISCQYLGLKAIKRTHELNNYIRKRKHRPSDTPIVTLRENGNYEILSPEQFHRYSLMDNVF